MQIQTGRIEVENSHLSELIRRVETLAHRIKELEDRLRRHELRGIDDGK